MTIMPIVLAQSQPICPYCNRLYSYKHGKGRQGCCGKDKCLAKHRAVMHEKELEQHRLYQKRTKCSPVNHIPKGQEGNDFYKFWQEKRPNPFGYRCHNAECNKVILWTYRYGELWDAPRYYCNTSDCQSVRDHRAIECPEIYVVHNRHVPRVNAAD